MKTLIRTKDIARVRHSENHAIDILRVTYTDGTYSEWVAEHYECEAIAAAMIAKMKEEDK